MGRKADNRLYWYAENAPPAAGDPPIRGAVVLLPGRSGHGYSLLRTYTEAFDFRGVGLFSVTPPISRGWYPPPNGPLDQTLAVRGLDSAAKTLDRVLDAIERDHDIPRDKVVVAGFSMGGVTAVHWATRALRPAAVICHSGAVLEPHRVPMAGHDRPIVLNHAQDDDCFGWEERYLPMRHALSKNNYNVWLAERESGNHHVYHSDVSCVKDLFEKTFGAGLEYEAVWKR